MFKITRDFCDAHNIDVLGGGELISIICLEEDLSGVLSDDKRASEQITGSKEKKALARILEEKDIPFEIDCPIIYEDDKEEKKKIEASLPCLVISLFDKYGMDIEEAMNWAEKQETLNPVFCGKYIMPLILKNQEMDIYYNYAYPENYIDPEMNRFESSFGDIPVDPDNETEAALYSLIEDERREWERSVKEEEKKSSFVFKWAKENWDRVRAEYNALLNDNTVYTKEQIMEYIEKDKAMKAEIKVPKYVSEKEAEQEQDWETDEDFEHEPDQNTDTPAPQYTYDEDDELPF